MNRFIRFKVFICIFWILLVLLNCKKTDSNLVEKFKQNSTVSIAAAANLRDVLEELKQIYITENPHQKIEITFGSSGLLVQQILNGAPFDLFLSADSSFPEKLKKTNESLKKPEFYAYGKIAIWSSKFDVSEGLNSVLNSKVKKIAIANPQLAPYGKSSIEALKKANLYSEIENKIVWAENINQTAQFASTGNADLAFVALSNTMNKEMLAKGRFYELSESECPAIPQSGIVLNDKNPAEAQLFFDFIKSDKTSKIWKKYGYQTKKDL